jgi:hypothetical protein
VDKAEGTLKMQQVEKILSRNDVGATGGHQAGIAVPRQSDLLAFFPALDSSETNPRVDIRFLDRTTDLPVTFSYIYYNGKLSGVSTRNEYRLTGMSKYLRSHDAQAGDTVVFTKDENSQYFIDFRAAVQMPVEQEELSEARTIITLSGKWLRKS